MVVTRGKPEANYEQLLLDDTRAERDRLVPIVKAKTGPGTGFLLKGTTGIGPICALIASENLGNNDFSEEAARKASCLQVKVFKETLQTIRLVLASQEAKRGRAKATYAALVDRYSFTRADFMVACMQKAERTLAKNGGLPRELAPPSDVVTVAVFMWVCQVLKRDKKVDLDELLDRYDIAEEDYADVAAALKTSCKKLADDIHADALALRDTPAGTPSRRTLSRSPSKPSLRSTTTPGLPTPTGTPAHKRKVAFAPNDDDAMQLDEPTPTKRPRASPHKTRDLPARNAYSAFQAALVTPTRPPTGALADALQASSSRLTLDLLASARGDDEDEPEPTTEENDEGVLPAALVSGTSGAEDGDIEMADAEDAASAPESAPPMTPRRSSRVPKPVFRSPDDHHTPSRAPTTPLRTPRAVSSPRKAKPPASPHKGTSARMTREEDSDEELPRERRTRPVLASAAQWFVPDARAAREWAEREARFRAWAGQRGGLQVGQVQVV